MVSKSTLERASSLFGVIVEKDVSISDIRKMTIAEYNQTFNKNITKQESLDAQKRLTKIIQDNLADIVEIYDRKQQSKREKAISQFVDKDVLAKGKTIFQEKKPSKIIQKKITSAQTRKGNAKFFAKVDKAKQIYGLTDKEATYRVRKLLRIPRKDISKLSKLDKEIIYTV